ncbi:MAG: YqgE/AlgH family protein [Verrucomicrobia bacterium]|nr:YqgE/AlgH family protein [Verrucomicrobiota bacterium]
MSTGKEENSPADDDLPDDEADEEAEETGDASTTTFAGSLLVAHPNLRDPNFRRSVLYLSAHSSAGGALGVILNRPLGTTAADLLPHHESRELLTRVPVYHGGPVGQDQLSFAELRWGISGKSDPTETCQLRCHLALDEVTAMLSEGAFSASPPHGGKELRAVVGYAGWSGGQLEAEMKEHAWLLIEPQDNFFSQPLPAREKKMWFRVLSSLGPAYKLLAAAPDDPSLN